MNILDHPLIKDLAPENDREGLLFFKAYITAIEATLSTVREFGLELAEAKRREIMAKFAEKAGLVSDNQEGNDGTQI